MAHSRACGWHLATTFTGCRRHHRDRMLDSASVMLSWPLPLRVGTGTAARALRSSDGFPSHLSYFKFEENQTQSKSRGEEMFTPRAAVCRHSCLDSSSTLASLQGPLGKLTCLLPALGTRCDCVLPSGMLAGFTTRAKLFC